MQFKCFGSYYMFLHYLWTLRHQVLVMLWISNQASVFNAICPSTTNVTSAFTPQWKLRSSEPVLAQQHYSHRCHRRVKCCSLPFPPLISISSCHQGIQTGNLPVPASHVLTPQARLELKSCSSESSEVIFCLFAEAETLTTKSGDTITAVVALCDCACESLRDKCDVIKCFVFSDHQFKPLADWSQGRVPILIFKDNNVWFKSDLHSWSIHYIDWRSVCNLEQ